MAFDAALNLIWALVAAGALGVLAVVEMRRERPTTLRLQCRRAVALLIAAVALFPCVSASDDLVRFENLELGAPVRSEVGIPAPVKSRETPTYYLSRLLEALENFQISAASRSFVILCFFALVRTAGRLAWERCLPSPTGRAPPLSSPFQWQSLFV